MQFPVPQFTEVEDKIIGPLTVKQFGILLLTGGVIFFAYSLSKDYYVTGAAAVLVGIPGLAITFGQFNGRPMYVSAFVFLNYLTRPRFFIFHKEAEGQSLHAVKDLEQKPVAAPKEVLPGEDPRSRLHRIQDQLKRRADQEAELLQQKK